MLYILLNTVSNMSACQTLVNSRVLLSTDISSSCLVARHCKSSVLCPYTSLDGHSAPCSKACIVVSLYVFQLQHCSLISRLPDFFRFSRISSKWNFRTTAIVVYLLTSKRATLEKWTRPLFIPLETWPKVSRICYRFLYQHSTSIVYLLHGKNWGDCCRDHDRIQYKNSRNNNKWE